MSTSARRRQRGQTTTEYVLILSVLVIALAGVSYEAFFKSDSPVRDGLNQLVGQNPTDSKTNVPTAVGRGYVSANPRPN
ncbi:MAG: hypothetical protein ACKO6N_19375 [Myxococcota bacterium]